MVRYSKIHFIYMLYKYSQKLAKVSVWVTSDIGVLMVYAHF